MNPALETLARIAEVEFSQIVVDTAQPPSHVIASRFFGDREAYPKGKQLPFIRPD
jgi:hypothetical protein